MLLGRGFMPTLLKKKLRLCTVVFNGFAALIASTLVNSATVTVESIVLIGDPILGVPAGITIDNVTAPILNNQGEIAFAAILASPDFSPFDDNQAILTYAEDNLSIVVRTGDTAPGAGNNASFLGFGGLSFSDQGEVAFTSSVITTGMGMAPDDAPNSINPALFSNAGGNLSLVAMGGEPLTPGMGMGNNVDTFDSFFDPVINDQGVVAFRVEIDEPNVTFQEDRAIFRAEGDTISLVAREGDAAPDVGADVTFAGFLRAPSLNDQGEIAFQASLDLEGADVTLDNDGVIFFADAGGTLSLVAREGDAVPTVGESVSFRVLTNPSLNDQGEIAFFATFDGVGVDFTNNSALFRESDGVLSLVARAGDSAPSVGSGVSFDFFGLPSLNDQGDVAFQSSFEGAGVTDANDSGIFLESDGMLSLLVREGDIIDLGGGDLATILALTFGGIGFDDLREGGNGFNDLGQIAFFADLTDGRSGIFLASPDGIVVSPVPLPAALPLMASGLLGLVAIARRRRSAHA